MPRAVAVFGGTSKPAFVGPYLGMELLDGNTLLCVSVLLSDVWGQRSFLSRATRLLLGRAGVSLALVLPVQACHPAPPNDWPAPDASPRCV